MTKEGFVEESGYSYFFDLSACTACEGGCCRGESGYIWVKYDEIEAIAEFLGTDVENFAKMYLRKVGHRYSLTEKEIKPNDYACSFFDLESNKCSIYPVRPKQCRTFPFWEQFRGNEEDVLKECPGIRLKDK